MDREEAEQLFEDYLFDGGYDELTRLRYSLGSTNQDPHLEARGDEVYIATITASVNGEEQELVIGFTDDGEWKSTIDQLLE